MDLNKFDEPFAADDIEWRIQQSGKTGAGKVWAMVLAYVTNRAIMKRLDDVCGKAGWKNEYRDIPNNGGVECGISIKVGDEWITKWDAAEQTQVEAVKGGRSGAMKRAAVQWGIGRYLYDLEEGFAQISTEKEKSRGWNRAKLKDGTTFYWLPPNLPSWAMPGTSEAHVSESQPIQDISNDANTDAAESALFEFEALAGKVTSVEALQEAYKDVWPKLGGSKTHEERCTETYRTRGKELQTQQAA